MSVEEWQLFRWWTLVAIVVVAFALGVTMLVGGMAGPATLGIALLAGGAFGLVGLFDYHRRGLAPPPFRQRDEP